MLFYRPTLMVKYWISLKHNMHIHKVIILCFFLHFFPSEFGLLFKFLCEIIDFQLVLLIWNIWVDYASRVIPIPWVYISLKDLIILQFYAQKISITKGLLAVNHSNPLPCTNGYSMRLYLLRQYMVRQLKPIPEFRP